MKYKKTVGAFILMGAVFITSPGHAATESYVFGNLYHPEENEGYTDPTNFSSLSVVTSDTGNWTFRIEAYGLSKYFGDSAFFGGLAALSNDKGVKVTNVKSGSGVNVEYKKTGMIYQGKNSGGFTFDFGKGQDRLVDSEWVEWTVSGLSSILGYAAHVQGINVGGINDGSAWYEASPNPVPLPAAFWLVGSALLGFTGFKKYVNSKNHSAEGSTVSNC